MTSGEKEGVQSSNREDTVDKSENKEEEQVMILIHSDLQIIHLV